MKKVISICLMSVALVGCSTMQKTDVDASHQLAGSMESSLDSSDRLNLNNALETTPTNQTTNWQNSKTKNIYAVTPTQTYYISGKPCRNYALAGEVDDKKDTYQGKACRNSAGIWEPAENAGLKK